MSKNQIVRSLHREIKKINGAIDRKILAGMPYHIESRHHKFLVSQLHRLSPVKSGIFGRSLGFVSMFMF